MVAKDYKNRRFGGGICFFLPASLRKLQRQLPVNIEKAIYQKLELPACLTIRTQYT